MTSALLNPPSDAVSPFRGAATAGKYLTFRLGTEYYGIAVLKIREIIRLATITPIPEVPDHVRGVVNLRGKIIPVVDLRRLFQLSAKNDEERICILIVQVSLPGGEDVPMGMMVDSVEEVVDIPSADIEATPRFGSCFEADYIIGMAKIKGQVKTLLNIDHLIASHGGR